MIKSTASLRDTFRRLVFENPTMARWECYNLARQTLGRGPLPRKIASVGAARAARYRQSDESPLPPVQTIRRPPRPAGQSDPRPPRPAGQSDPRPKSPPAPAQPTRRQYDLPTRRQYDLTRDYVVDHLMDIIDRAKNANPPNLNAANKALHLLGLEVGMFAQVVKREGDFDPNRMPDAELIAIVKAYRRMNGSGEPADKDKLN